MRAIYARTEALQQSFAHATVHVWNNLPIESLQAQSFLTLNVISDHYFYKKNFLIYFCLCGCNLELASSYQCIPLNCIHCIHKFYLKKKKKKIYIYIYSASLHTHLASKKNRDLAFFFFFFLLLILLLLSSSNSSSSFFF